MSVQPVRGIAAGVPFLALAPASGDPDAPIVVAWHLMDPPRTEGAFAAALPLSGLDAWRIYLGLPMCGERLSEGGPEELMRLGYEDAVMNLQGPIAAQGAAEFPAALAALRARLGLQQGPLALVGGSMGSAVAALVLTEAAPAAGEAVAAAVLISPMVRLRAAVEATGRRFGVTYPWAPRSLEVAARLDFVARAQEIAATGQPALQLIVGEQDDAPGFLAPAQQLQATLAAHYDDPTRVELVVVPGMGHALAEEPGIGPAPQIPAAEAVDRHATAWLHRHLRPAGMSR
jgi:alpha-beta hydrolase superfamily lysophospholipase